MSLKHVQAKSDKPIAKASLLVGSATAGVCEISLFHPIDTIAKRLMSNQDALLSKQVTWGERRARAASIVFGAGHEKTSFARRYMGLYKGFSYAAVYKVFQRIYKFGGTPLVSSLLDDQFHGRVAGVVGHKNTKAVMDGVAGAIIGIGEVSILPFDQLKIKGQTRPESIAGRSTFQIFREEGMALYRGTWATIARNAPGSFFLFGGATLTKTHMFHLGPNDRATFLQNTVASIVGSTTCILVGCPADVVKTRVQNRPFDRPETGRSIVKNLLAKEGPMAFYKGFTPKFLIVGPKLIFSFTMAQTLIQFVDAKLYPVGR